MPATPERVALISSPFRFAIAADETVKSIVPSADSLEEPGFFNNAADAEAINDTVFALRSDPAAQFYQVDFEGELDPDFNGKTPHFMGDDIEGLQPGRKYIIVAGQTAGETTTLTLWG